MAKFDRHFIDSKVRYLFDQARKQNESTSSDPFALARLQRVWAVDVRPMIPSGGLAFRDDGFVIYVRDLKLKHPVQFILGAADQSPQLSRRQRFTCAHELVHTFFFGLGDPPVKLEGYPRTSAMEQLCQYGARHVLLPDTLMGKALANCVPIRSKFVCDLAQEHTVSPEVVIRRLADAGTVAYSTPSLLMARNGPSDKDATIVATFVDASLLVHRRRPELYSSLANWAGALLDEHFWEPGVWQRSVRLGGSVLSIRKLPYRSRSFFLEIEVA